MSQLIRNIIINNRSHYQISIFPRDLTTNHRHKAISFHVLVVLLLACNWALNNLFIHRWCWWYFSFNRSLWRFELALNVWLYISLILRTISIRHVVSLILRISSARCDCTWHSCRCWWIRLSCLRNSLTTANTGVRVGNLSLSKWGLIIASHAWWEMTRFHLHFLFCDIVSVFLLLNLFLNWIWESPKIINSFCRCWYSLVSLNWAIVVMTSCCCIINVNWTCFMMYCLGSTWIKTMITWIMSRIIIILYLCSIWVN